jgi:integration host factor subunit beta
MTKSQLIERVASRTRHISKRDIEIVVDTLFGSMAEALVRGERIEIRGFGSFRVRVREAHEGLNPKTRERIQIPARRRLLFRVAKELHERINHSTPAI